MIACSRSGTFATIGEVRPEQATASNTVRAAFIRFLALGGDESVPVSDRVQVQGAYVTGNLNFTGGSAPVILSFLSCTFECRVSVQTAHFRGLGFSGCRVPGIYGDGLRLDGALMLRQGFEATAPVYLTGARIEGDIDATDSRFVTNERTALSLNKAVVEGDLILNRLHVDSGEVMLTALQIRGSLFCAAGQIINAGKLALGARGLKVGGDVGLNAGFCSQGELRLMGAQIGGDLNCRGGSFLNRGGRALNCQTLKVEGGLIWREIARVEGIVDFTSAAIGSLVDDADSWDQVETARFDGFRYDRFLGAETPTDAAMRIAWLLKQEAHAPGTRFWSSPWEQLVKVLREMGHPEDARLVAIAKQRALRRAGAIGNRKTRPGLNGVSQMADRLWVKSANALSRMLHRIYGLLAGYGYRPLRTVGWMLILWLIAGLFYAAGEREGLFGPTNPRIYADMRFGECRSRTDRGDNRWTACERLPPEHAAFEPFIYSLDVILPLVDLKQETEWAPIVHGPTPKARQRGYQLRAIMWFEILFGWIGSLLMVSAVGRLIERE
jgi:hypothetical protein